MQTVALRLRRQWETVTWTTVLWVVASGLLFWGSKWAGKLCEGIPGHAGAFWIPTLFLARTMVRKPGASTLSALLGASLWCYPHGQFFNLSSYLAAALVLDAMDFNSDVNPGQHQRGLRYLPLALVGGGLAHMAKFAFHNLPMLTLGARGGFITWGMGVTAGLHLLFGVFGGFIGWTMVRGMERLQERRTPPHE